MKTEAYHKYLRDNTLPVCFICQQSGHMSTGCPNKTRPLLPQNGPTQRYPLQQSSYHYYANSAHQATPPTQTLSSSQSFHLPAANTASTSQPFCTLKAPPAIITGVRFCHAYNQTGRCTAGCPEESHNCNRAGCGEPHPGNSCPKILQQ